MIVSYIKYDEIILDRKVGLLALNGHVFVETVMYVVFVVAGIRHVQHVRHQDVLCVAYRAHAVVHSSTSNNIFPKTGYLPGRLTSLFIGSVSAPCAFGN